VLARKRGHLFARTVAPLFAATALLSIGCGAAQVRPCRASTACKPGEACVLGSCSNDSSSPVEASTRRVVLEPEVAAWVSSEGDDPSIRPAAATLGGDVGARYRVLLKFRPGDFTKDSVKKAYLVMQRAEGAQAGPGEVSLRVERILEAWSLPGSALVTWASPPRSEPITGGEARVAARGASVIRIDVTEVARALASKNARVYGLRVEGTSEGYGVPIATGVGGVPGPVLEVYVQ
jgi:hypothetical protein